LRVLVGAAALSFVVAVVVIAPWRGHSAKPVLHAIIEGPQLQQTIVDLKTGTRRPVLQREEYWFDSQRNLLRFKSSVGGRVIGQGLRQSNPSGQASVSPALETFVTGYRQALASGEAHEVGHGLFDGRQVIWLTLPDGSSRQRVAIDAATYRPRVIEELGSNGKPEPLVWQVRTIEMVPRERADFVVPPAVPESGAQISPLASVSPAKAASLLGWTPVWLGRSFSGLTLGAVQPLRVTESHGVPVTEKRGLLLNYNGRNSIRVTIQEGRLPGLIDGFSPLDPLPTAGEAVLTNLSTGCRAQVETNGVWMTIIGFSNDACIGVARALVPIGAPIASGKPIASSTFLGYIKAPAPAPAAAGPRAALCAGAWNLHASARQRLSIANDQSASAAVSGSGSTRSINIFGSTSGGKTFSSNSSTCAITFFLSKDRIAVAFGAWTNGTVARWQGPLGPTPMHVPPGMPEGNGNASVAADGTVHLH
jgi:hypothetical protein